MDDNIDDLDNFAELTKQLEELLAEVSQQRNRMECLETRLEHLQQLWEDKIKEESRGLN